MEDQFEFEIQAAQFGARLAGRGFTPAQIEDLMRAIWPALAAARRAVESGADPNTIRWTLQAAPRSDHSNT